MEESVAGFKEQGDWVTIVEHGERITEALTEEGVEDSDSDFEEWNDWRPKVHERLREDVKEKTAEQASPSEGEGEKAGKSPSEDVDAAGDELKDSMSELADGDVENAVKEGQESVERATRAVDTAGRKALRAVEETVYKHVMTKVSPVYFDNELISANVERTRDTDQRYVFEVNVNQDDLKDRVRDRLEEYEEQKRWRGEAEKETESVEAAEGTESPESPESGN
ncbi:hypothetical protein SAMN05421858_2247 [Haladaptatus litoreus]|uniref:Uncharacterized protein n=1 Tax=Haladaptatus litoreus TaxID=553468 RepID=A0A1N6ZZK6_9EURY|nr:DUF5828 family protein [Haladaptatus litoreus]SIR32264.1 hypothetical protein SAMN05421858_2247 [Haladaptatus litoreus]